MAKASKKKFGAKNFNHSEDSLGFRQKQLIDTVYAGKKSGFTSVRGTKYSFRRKRK